MMPWLRFERRWRDALLEATLPMSEDGARPSLTALELESFWRRFRAGTPALLRLGVRVAVWLFALGPVFLIGRFRTFRGLTPDERDRLLVKVNGHRRFLLRQLALTLKLVACWAYFSDDAARAAVASQREPAGG